MAWTYKATVTASNSGSAKTNYQHKIELTLGDTTVDVESSSGQKVVSVAATTGFTAGDFVILDAGNANEEWGQIDTISAGVSITLLANLTNTHAVSVVVSNADQHIVDNTQATGADLRVTPVGDITTVLDHWIEIWDGTDHVLWVEIPSIGAAGSTDVDVHYGGGAVASTSDIEATFLLGEDAWDINDFLPGEMSGTGEIKFADARTGAASLGTSGAWNDQKIYEQSNVLYDPDDTNAARRYKLYISGNKVADSIPRQGLYFSADGITWTEYASNPIQSSGSDLLGEDAYVLKDGSTYHMYIEHHNGTAYTSNIYHHTSTDGITWTEDTANNPVLDVGGPGDYDEEFAQSPVVWIHDGTWYMLYEAADAGQVNFTTAIADSSDGVTWTKDAVNNPLDGPQVVYDIIDYGTEWIMWGGTPGGSNTKWRTTVADPADWVTASFTSITYGIGTQGQINDLPLDGVNGTAVTQIPTATTDDMYLWFVTNSGTKWSTAGRANESLVVTDGMVKIDSGTGALTIDGSGVPGDRGFIVYSTDAPVTNNFALRLRRKTTPISGQDNHNAGTFGFGSGTANGGSAPRWANGYHAVIDEPDLADKAILNRTLSGATLNLATGTITTADAEAYLVHELQYTSAGDLTWVKDGSNFLTANNTLHLSTNKQICLGAGARSNNEGIHDIDWLAVRVYDGTDTTNAIGQPAAENVPSIPPGSTSPNSLSLGGHFGTLGTNLTTR